MSNKGHMVSLGDHKVQNYQPGEKENKRFYGNTLNVFYEV